MVVSLRASPAEIEAAVTALRDGDVVAFPTETVYGLGGNARDPSALRRIFELKGRPADHPLIVHLDSPRFLPRWARDIPPAAHALAEAFWPGPLTLVLARGADVSDLVTGGQDTVAVRVPSHPMAQQLLKAFGGGIAAPSANRYGRISPTRPEHVREEFGDAVRVVLDAGEATLGLESTIVSLVGETPRILRPGHVAQADLERVLGRTVAVGPAPGAPRVPGALARHYAPGTPLVTVSGEALEARLEDLLDMHARIAVLALRAPRRARPNVTWINAGRRPDLYAHDLYANLRSLDRAGAGLILVEEPPAEPRWDAIRDRLRRAEGRGAVADAVAADLP